MKRRFRDRDFIETADGFFFCVVGGIHPAKRVIAYLKYVPDKAGKWGNGRRRFKRVLRNYTIPALSETLESLRREYPEYLFFSRYLHVLMSGVPIPRIVARFLPEVRLHELLCSNELDNLEEKLIALIELLSQKSGVSKDAFGVTGSILLGIHQTAFSDLDIIVYGRNSSLQVKKALTPMYEDSSSRVSKLHGDQMVEWCSSKVELYSLSYDEARELLTRRWNRGLFGSTLFSVHPVLMESEQIERYGDRSFNPLGFSKIEAKVSSNTEAMFLPSTYEVSDVRILEGPGVKGLREVCSYQGIYSDILRPEERLIARGKLEHVKDKRTGEEYCRILIGGLEARGEDYIKPLG